MAPTTRLNGQSLLDCTAPGADYLVGTDVSDTITVAFTALAAATDAFTSTALGLVVTAGPLAVDTATGAAQALTAIDTAINNIPETRATDGALFSRFELRGPEIDTSLEHLDAAQ